MELKAGQIVTVDWRKEPDDPAQDPQPPEPNTLRPAVVVRDTELFDPAYPTVLVVPMTGDPALAIPDLTVVVQPRTSRLQEGELAAPAEPDLRGQDTDKRRHQVTDHPCRTAAAASVGGAEHRRAELTTPAALPPT